MTIGTRPSGPVVVVTGASAGVGRAVARGFARQGARIGLLARGRQGLAGALDDVEALGGEAIALPTDVADADAVEAAAAAVEERFGPIDVWVNNAMASVFSTVAEMKAEEYRRVTDVTYLGYVHGTLSALRRMKPRDRGVIVQVGSALAYRSIPLQSAYCAAKAAVRGFTDSLRCELQHDGSKVKLTMVQMPALNTPQFNWVKSRLPGRGQPVPPIFQPEVAASAVLFAARHPRRELWVGLPSYKAILSAKLAPSVGDWFLSRHGFRDQQTDQSRDRDRPDNLWEPVDEESDFGAHGRFDDRAVASSGMLWATENRGWLAAGAAGVLCGVLAVLGRSRRRD